MARLEPERRARAVCSCLRPIGRVPGNHRLHRSLDRDAGSVGLNYDSRFMPQLLQNTFISAPPKHLVLENGFRFSHGETIAPFTIQYETFGELNADRSNAILACHALSANAHAAGKYTNSDEERPGWWDGLIGYGKGIDLEKYFIVCANLPGSCFGTTAPASIDPANGRPYGSRYPWPVIEDMVHSQKAVLDDLGISHLRSIAGGSLGGMQVLMWTALYPDFADSIIAMACGAAVPVSGI